jgi:hypothetical protein
MAEFFIMTMTNRFTGNIASAAMILGSLTGLGLAIAPAQAALFTLAPTTGGQVVPDTEWGAGSNEAIWSTWFNSTTGPTTPPGAPPGVNGTTGVDGYNNPLISHSGSGTHFKIEYFGSGNALLTNDFKWNGVSVFGAHNGATDGAVDNDNNFGTLALGGTAVAYRDIVNGVLPFSFDAGGIGVNNGAAYSGGNQPHYFATINGTSATSGGPSITLGLSDRPLASDDDSADYVVRITQVQPEPSGILGLLAMSGLGLVAKMRKQK